jgi:hypothetical protein
MPTQNNPSLLGKLVIVTLCIAFASGIYYFRDQTIDYVQNTFSKPCADPIPYSIGSIDPKFGVSKEQVATKLAQASELWNSASGKQLFVYAPLDSNAIPVSFIYDRRQETVTLSSSINSTGALQQEEREQLEVLQKQYSTAQEKYGRAVTELTKKYNAYNQKVQKVNASGGADPQTFAQLEKEKSYLAATQETLETQHLLLQEQSVELGQKIALYNTNVADINKVVRDFNATSGGDFEEGLYSEDATGKRISIYAYKSQSELLHSLTHELGHALGLEHNQNPLSIMFPYNKSGVTLSTDDLADLKELCDL